MEEDNFPGVDIRNYDKWYHDFIDILLFRFNCHLNNN